MSSAEITPRGKAVSVSTRGNELRVWELEGGFASGSRKRLPPRTGLGKALLDKSVRIRPESRHDVEEGGEEDTDKVEKNVFTEEIEARKQWVGFDDEVVIVLKESGEGTQALIVYDFT